jgi:hypothetical protein
LYTPENPPDGSTTSVPDRSVPVAGSPLEDGAADGAATVAGLPPGAGEEAAPEN